MSAAAVSVWILGDHCQGCRFDPRERTSQNTLGLKRFSPEERQALQEKAERFLEGMQVSQEAS